MMKKYSLTPQEKDDWCVPACLQAILRHDKKEISQKKISEKLTKLGKGFHMDDYKIKNFLRKNGFEYVCFENNKTPFNEPDMVLKEMTEDKNHGIIGINGHTYVLREFNDPYLRLSDPKDGSILEKDLLTLYIEMHENILGGVFGLIKRL